jgi:small multidrug resistance family-3 protein
LPEDDAKRKASVFQHAAVLLFVLAGLAEIGGGYLMWIWLRRAESVYLGIIGAAILVLYGVIPTF